MTRPILRRSRTGTGRALRLASVAALPLIGPTLLPPSADAATVSTRIGYVVQPGDTLGGIALRFGTDVATLVRLNGLTNPDVLLAGTALVVPAPAVRTPHPAPTPAPRGVTYTVRPGDTLWDIADRAGISLESLLAANDLDPQARIRPGQVLQLPGLRPTGAPTPHRPKPARVVVVVVQPGDTVSDIALRYRITVASIVEANGLGRDAVIRPGQKLQLPGAVPRRRARVPAPVTHAYVVRSGDTLSGIAEAAGVPLTQVLALNHLTGSSIIRPGQPILLPGPEPTAPLAGAQLAAFTTTRTPVRSAAAANRATLTRRRVPSAEETTRLVTAAARRYGVDPALALAVAHQESGFDQRRVSPANAIGVMQVVPSSGRWASRLVGRRLDLLDARDNVVAGVAILAALRTATAEETAVAAYYQGLASVREHGLFDDTRRYIAE